MYQFTFDVFNIFGGLLFSVFLVLVFTKHKKLSYFCLVVSLVAFAISVFSSWKEHSSSSERSLNPLDSAPHRNSIVTNNVAKKNLSSVKNMSQGAGFNFTSDKLFVEFGDVVFQFTRRDLLTKRCAIFILDDDTLGWVYLKGSKVFVNITWALERTKIDSSWHTETNVCVKNNSIVQFPSVQSYDANFDENALEVVDKDLKPMLQIIYKFQNYIVINAMCKDEVFVSSKWDTTLWCMKKGNFPFATMRQGCNLQRIFKYPSALYQGRRESEGRM